MTVNQFDQYTNHFGLEDAELEVVRTEPSKRVEVMLEVPAVSEADQEELINAGEFVDAEILDADAVAQEAEEVLCQVDDLQNETQALSALTAVADETLQDDGLSDDAMKILAVATEGIYRRLDIPQSRPAFESLDGFDYHQVTNYAVEGFSDSVKAFGNAVVEGIKKAWEFIQKFFDHILSATTRLESRAKKIQDLVKDFKGSKDLTIKKSASISNRLSIGNDVPNDIVKHLSEVNVFVTEATSSQKSEALHKLAEGITLVEKFKTEFKNIPGSDEQANTLQGGMNTYVGKHLLPLVKDALNLDSLKLTKLDAGFVGYNLPHPNSAATQIFSTPILPGNVIIWAHVPLEVAGILDTKIGKSNFKASAPGHLEYLPALSKSDVEKIAEEALHFVNLKRAFEEQRKKLNGIYSQLQKGMVAAAGGQLKEDVFNKDIFNGAVRYVRVLMAIFSGVHRYALSEGLAIHNAALDYAQLALSSVTKEEKVAMESADDARKGVIALAASHIGALQTDNGPHRIKKSFKQLTDGLNTITIKVN